MNKFQNGKIYKIISNYTDDIYIGSTTQKLCKRLSNHKECFKCYNKGTKKDYLTSYKIVQYEDAQIILIEDYPCDNKQKLEARERHFIELNNCVNKVIPTRTFKEYRDDNKQHFKEIKKDWDVKNKVHIMDYKKKYKSIIITCDCGAKNSIDNQARHLKTDKHKKLINQLYISELTNYNF